MFMPPPFDSDPPSPKPFIDLLEPRRIPEIKTYGLEELNKCVGYFWHEIVAHVVKIEALSDDTSFQNHQLAALVASKVYFHSSMYNESIQLALKAGDAFNDDKYVMPDFDHLYKDFITSKALDLYTKLEEHNAQALDSKDKKPIDPRLKLLAEQKLGKSSQSGFYCESIGFAMDSYRIDELKKLLQNANPAKRVELLSYVLKQTLDFVKNRKYRNEVLQCLVEVYGSLAKPDYINVCQCYIFLDKPGDVAEVLERLLRLSKRDALQAYQIAFDIYESATQEFVGKILTYLKGLETKVSESSTERPPSPPASSTQKDEEFAKRLTSLQKILKGDETVSLHLQFLIKNNKTDMLILKSMKDVVKTNITHNATVIANGLMHAGTTCDDFLRDNLEWVGKASNWAKFTTVASLGVIHKGHESDSEKLLETYLPKENAAGSTGYVEGGGMYAYGLIHANHGNNIVIDYLKNQLNRESGTDDNAAIVMKHGACLGLGLAAMGTHKQDVYDTLKSNLYTDDAVIGEAAAIAMGLVMLGSKSPGVVADMTTYAAETQHEKTLRGLSVGLSLLNYGRLEEATSLIETLRGDKDPNMRRSAVYTLAMAYCGTGSAKAVRSLLSVAASDVSDEVRRAASACIGFILCKSPEQCPTMVNLLIGSHNPHVRYGAAMALGIACAGTASKEALSLIEPLMNDAESYVRQGAFIATAMMLMQHNEVSSSKVKDFRATLTKIVADKGEDSMTKFGAIIARGIIDAAGRNACLSLITRNGHVDTAGVVGLLVFLQHWYWFPFCHFISLALRPTCLIALNSDLKMPKVEFKSNAKPSQFAYPPALEEKKEKAAEKVETAVLSITAKHKKKEQEKKQLQTQTSGSEKMDVDDHGVIIKVAPQAAATSQQSKSDVVGAPAAAAASVVEPPVVAASSATGADNSSNSNKSATTIKIAEPEPLFEMLNNPARVLNQQLKHVTFTNPRYQPIKSVNMGGIVLLDDKEPEKPSDLVELVVQGAASKAEDDKMCQQPEPFHYEP